MKTIGLALVLLCGAAIVIAADDPIADMPGYVDFADLAQNYGEPRVMVNIGGSLLKLLSAVKHANPAAEEALRNLDSVRVQVFDTAGNTQAAATRMEQASGKLTALNWEQIVRVREPGDLVNVYVKYSDERIYGLVVMAVDAEEALFVNILGDIDPAQLNEVVAQIDVVSDMDIDF
jgi:hypothetical protein